MKPVAATIIFVVLLFTAAATSLNAEVPAVMSYQGVLTDNSGNPIPDGNHTVTFRLYDLAQGGVPLWTEAHLLPVVGGVFGVNLGIVTPLDLPFDRTYYLGISIDSGAEMAPRRTLTAAAYSLSTKAIDDGVAVRSLNGLRDDVAIVGGDNVSVTQLGNTLTITSSGDGGGTTTTGANTLDAAYDEGGPGAGRVITADAGPVRIEGADGLVVQGWVGIGIDPPEVPVDVLSTHFYAIYGETSTQEQAGAGVCGALNTTTAGPGGSGVIGICLDPSATSNGVWGDHAGVGMGVFGTAPDGFGVAGLAYGQQSENVGIYGESAAMGVGWAGYFYGDVAVVGQILTGGGSAMLIDHPIDPEGKFLYHAPVQSPDMMNVYNGNVSLDNNGQAIVTMPDYFEALNSDFRYQLTAVGAPGPGLYIAEEIGNNQFKIAGGTPGAKVSWTVTGVRKDPQSEQLDRTVVRNKPANKTGRYFDPAAYGKDKSSSTLHAAHSQLLRQMRADLRLNSLSKRRAGATE